MTENDFLKIAKEKCCLHIVPPKDGKKYYYCHVPYVFCGEKDEKEKLTIVEAYLYESWSAGGVSGGSCWDTGKENPYYHTPGEPESEFKDLDDLLIAVCPAMSFLQYRRLSRDIVRGTYTTNEYYGNSSDTAFKVINLKKLYDILVEMGLIKT